MKPYQTIPIFECGEPLIPLPIEQLAVVTPHPYVQLGADYGHQSPYYLRAGVVKALIAAQNHLHQLQPGWRLCIFDAYRPVPVQQFMVDYTFQTTVVSQGLTPAQLSLQQQEQIYQQVYQFWAPPSLDPATPPPHSTGGAVDLTLSHGSGVMLDMGGALDEISPRSHPDYYADSPHPQEQVYRQSRQLLYQVMRASGFQRHPQEWWHFSLGDQMWAYLEGTNAYYGRVSP